MDQEKIQSTMDKLQKLRDESSVVAAETIVKQTELFCETLKVSYKKYIKDLFAEQDKDIESLISEFQTAAKKDNEFGSAYVDCYNLDQAAHILFDAVQSFCKESLDFIKKDFDTTDDAKKAGDTVQDNLQEHRIKFDSIFGSKSTKSVASLCPEIYFANKIAEDIASPKKDLIIETNIDSVQKIFNELANVDPDTVTKAYKSVLKLKQSDYQQGINTLKGMIGTYVRAINHAVNSINSKLK